MTFDGLVLSDWARDELPDLVWPLMLAARERYGALGLFREAQKEVLRAFPAETLASSGAALDGRLTSLERFAEAHRPQVVAILRELDERSRLIPPALIGVLSLYDALPGRWLLVDPWEKEVEIPSAAASATALADAIAGAIADASLNAITKAPSYGWGLMSGKIHLPPEMIEVLRDYPLDEHKRPAAEATIRSGFLSAKGLDAFHDPQALEGREAWRRSFWEQNRIATPCVVGEAVLPSERDQRQGLPSDDVIDAAVNAAIEAYESFVEFAFSVPIPEQHFVRHEVICGLVARAFRTVETTLEHPRLWSGEQASAASRSLIETHILLCWMRKQQDEDVFAKYQSYGYGKRKLMRRHVKDLLEASGDDAPEIARSLDESLTAATGGEWGEAFQEVSIDSTFSGVNVRQMADQVGLLDEYRHVYQPASGVTHGEWWAVEDYAMQRCSNPLHLFHLVPSMAETRIEPQFPELVLSYFSRILEAAARGLAGSGAESDEEAD